MALRLKRVYERAQEDDGKRILVDRLWPRGLSKTDAKVDAWPKDLAPSPALRRWFGHDPQKWSEFRERYRHELEKNRDAAEALKREIGGSKATLLYGARDEEHNHAIVLREFIEKA